MTPYLHLDPAHEALVLLDAPSAETVRDFLVMAGLFHITDMEFFPTTPVSELPKTAGDVPSIFP